MIPNEGEDTIRKVNALIRYFFHVDPDPLDDDAYAQMWQELVWVRGILKQDKDNE